MDPIDRAQVLVESQTEKALTDAKRALQTEREILPTSPDCQDCGEEIPAARRLAVPWASRCHYCQSEAEMASQRR